MAALQTLGRGEALLLYKCGSEWLPAPYSLILAPANALAPGARRCALDGRAAVGDAGDVQIFGPLLLRSACAHARGCRDRTCTSVQASRGRQH